MTKPGVKYMPEPVYFPFVMVAAAAHLGVSTLPACPEIMIVANKQLIANPKIQVHQLFELIRQNISKKK
jgi:hypothetical protein